MRDSRIPAAAFAILLAATIMCGCGGASDTAVRFKMERMLVQADRLQEQMKLKGQMLSEKDLGTLIDAYAAISEQVAPPRNPEEAAIAPEEKKQAWALSSLAVTRIGSLYLDRRMYDKAYDHFKMAADNLSATLVQRNAVLIYMALSMQKMGQYDRAAGLYDTLAQEYINIVVPENPNLDALDAPLRAVEMWRLAGDRDRHDLAITEAREYYLNIMEKFNGSLTESAAIGKLSASYLQEHRFGEAIDLLKTVRDDSTGRVTPSVMLTIADIYMNRIRDLSNAERTYREFAEYYPDHEKAQEAYLGLGLSLYEQRKFEEARKAVSSIDKLRKVSQEYVAQAYFLAALCYEKEDKWELAKGQFDIVQSTFIGTEQGFEATLYVVDHYRRRGQSDLEQKAFNDAVNYINRYAEQNKANPGSVSKALGYLVRAYTESGDLEKAADRLAFLHDQYPQYPEGRFAPLRLGDIYENELGDTSKAIAWLKIFIDENPQAANLDEIKGHVGTLEARLGRHPSNK